MESYDIFMASGRENTWALPFFSEALQEVAQSYIDYPPRSLQSDAYSGPVTIKRFCALREVHQALEEKGTEVDALK